MMERVQLVRADIPPDKGETHSARRRRNGIARRELLSLVGRASLATAFALTGVFARAQAAFATDRTPYYPYADDNNNGGYCPGSPLSGSTGCCECGSYVSSAMCGSDIWHLHHNVSPFDYDLRETSCGGYNAWRWTKDSDGQKWRCSDGKYKYYTISTWSNSVCPKQLI